LPQTATAVPSSPPAATATTGAPPATAIVPATRAAPNDTPAPTQPPATQSASPATTVLPAQYTVVAGDTIWAIAAKFGLTAERLAAANPGVNPDLLHPGDVLVIPGPNDPLPTAPANQPVATRPPSQTGGLPSLDNLTGITGHARAIYDLGQTLGNRPDVFSRVGDSITASPVFLYGIGLGTYQLHDYAQFQAVIDYYSTAAARENANSFANPSLAAKTNWRAAAVLDPSFADTAICQEGEAPLACEFRLVRPAVALIMLGTNDVPSTSDANFEADYRRVIEFCLEKGVIPVVSTIPPLFRVGLEGRAEELNVIITALAREYDVPLWDYYSALQGLPGAGMAHDGVHPNSAPAGHNADFSAEYLQYGMVVRNLNALYVLDEIWRRVIQP
jgi:LysM repeat protein